MPYHIQLLELHTLSSKSADCDKPGEAFALIRK